MDRRTDVLDILRGADGWVSGAALSRTLAISRNAIHKHVQRLIRAGYHIEARPRRGYRLIDSGDRLHSDAMLPRLRTQCFGKTGWCYADEMDSTNQELRRRAEHGAPHGVVVLADTQTEGRGRKGRSWVSPPGVGLYVSLLLRPRMAIEHVPMIALSSAVATAGAIREITGLPAQIKWPNDILVEGRKVAGLLLDATSEPDAIEFVIVGLGLNINTPMEVLPPRPVFPAGSLRDASGAVWPRAELLAAWLYHMEAGWRLLEEGHTAPILDQWRQWSVTRGRAVRIQGARNDLCGTVHDIGEDGALLLKDAHGAITRVFSGDLQWL